MGTTRHTVSSGLFVEWMTDLIQVLVTGVVAGHRDIVGLSGGGRAWTALKRKLKSNRTSRIVFHEIIAVTKTGGGQTEEKTETERKDLTDIRTVTNVLFHRQLDSCFRLMQILPL